MNERKKAGFSAYAATPLMTIAGNIVASLVFIFALNDSSPVPVFAFFTLLNVINMGLFAVLPKKRKHIVRRVNMVLFSLTLVVFFGTLGRQNLQIEGLFFLTAAGVWGGVTTHFLVGKIVGPLFFGRNWCGWSCWTVMVLDWLPYKDGQGWRGGQAKNVRYMHFGFALAIVLVLVFGFAYTVHNPAQKADQPGTLHEMIWFVAGYGLYYLAGVILAIRLKDNRAFCKYLCPVTVFLKGATVFSMLRIKGDAEKCNDCGRCTTDCIMDIDIPSYTKEGLRVKSSECVMCMQCIAACPEAALKSSVGLDMVRDEKWKRYRHSE